MNNISRAQRAYGAANTMLSSHRDTERTVIGRITHRLRAAASNPSEFSELAAALTENRMLWTRLASDVADPDNALPQDLRSQLFYLAEFTEKHSSLVLRGQASATVLVEINSAVMRGLSGPGQDTRPAKEGVA